jgi:hypothetical protein
MPVLTALKAEIGTTGEIARVDVAQGVYGAVRDAVREEHYCDDTDTCDIARAWHDSFPMVAAEILQGATETPLLDAVLAYFGEGYRVALASQWPAWSEHFAEIAHMCEECNGATFGDDIWTPEECGHCGAALPAAS